MTTSHRHPDTKERSAMGSTLRPSRTLLPATLMSALAIGAVVAPQALLSEPAAADGRTVTVGPSISGAALTDALERLRPGDTLALAPGTYRTGFVIPNPSTSAVLEKMSPGLPGAPITVRAADPSRRPLLLGELKLWGPSYWVLDGLRVQAVDSGKDALFMGGGTGWTVRNSEFSGARQTGAYSNVSIGADIYGSGAPRGFSFTGNCVHDAAASYRKNTDHNVYVNYPGTPGSGGVISRNVIFNHYNGVGIKIGNGGAVRAPGPWNVKVEYNTIAQGGRQILLHADVRNNTMTRNLLASSTEPFNTVNKTTSVYFNIVVGKGNTMINNYAAGSTMFSFGGNVALRGFNAVGSNPGFSSGGCGGFKPTNPVAAGYGRYAGTAFARR